jgi:hypothetical protein
MKGFQQAREVGIGFCFCDSASDRGFGSGILHRFKLKLEQGADVGFGVGADG